VSVRKERSELSETKEAFGTGLAAVGEGDASLGRESDEVNEGESGQVALLCTNGRVG
jgi:hypothetical protein